MNKRHTSLDGLRGFAALSVFFAHAGFNIAAITSIPIILVAYSTLAVGTNAVQILFVLSGFLMAYLYSEETHTFRFIRKRYTRIFPVYLVIIAFLWFAGLSKWTSLWYIQLLLLFVTALVFHFGWKTIRKVDVSGKVRTGLFIGFIIFQLFLIGLVLLLEPRFVHYGHLEYPGILIGLSNLTLTTDFVKDMLRLSNQAWSLVPEVLFYIFFPFMVIPLISLAKKRGVLVGLLLVIGMTKIFFDLDTAFYSFLNLQSMNIARSSGFIAGVVIGIIYKSQGRIWQTLEKIFSKSWVGIAAFLIFLYVQWSVGDAIANGTSSITDLNIYYLISSWIIVFMIAAVLLPNTAMSRFFGHKYIAFFGVISYSVYLIHTSMLEVSRQVMNIVRSFISSNAFTSISEVLLGLVLTIVVSYLLFRFIESLYFLDKKHLNNKALTKTVVEEPVRSTSRIKIIIAGIIFAAVLIFCYSGSYASSLIIARNPIPQVSNKSEIHLGEHPLFIPFTAQYQNLSEAVILLRYVNTSGFTMDKIKEHRLLVFRLYTQDRKKMLMESKRDAFEVDGLLRFPFGFPTLPDSQNKNYVAELSLQGPANGEDIYVDTSPTSFVGVYIHSPMSRIKILPSFLINRLAFALSNPDAQFALAFLVFVILLELSPKNFSPVLKKEKSKVAKKKKK